MQNNTNPWCKSTVNPEMGSKSIPQSPSPDPVRKSATEWLQPQGVESPTGDLLRNTDDHQDDINQNKYLSLKHVSKSLPDGTCLLAFQTAYRYDPQSLPEIVRICLNGDGQLIQQNGSIVGVNRRMKSAVVICAKPGDVIRITECCCKQHEHKVRFYKVGKDFKPRRLKEYFESFADQISIDRLGDAVNGQLTPWDSDWDGLSRIFSFKWPDWLNEIVRRQKLTLFRNDNRAWHHVDSRSFSARYFRSIVSKDPYQALERWRKNLTDRQVQSCIKRSPEGAIRFAFDKMTPAQIDYAVFFHSECLLQYAAEKLSEKQIRLCVTLRLAEAFEFRTQLKSKHQAIILSHALSTKLFELKPLSESVIDEILLSLRNHFAIWVETYKGDYLRLIADLNESQVCYFATEDGVITYESVRDFIPESEMFDFLKYYTSRTKFK